MSLIAEVAKSSVTRGLPKQWSISLLVTLKEDEVTVREETISEDYKTGDSIPDIGAMLLEKAQAIIDKYKSEKGIFDNPSLDAVVAAIQAGLEV